MKTKVQGAGVTGEETLVKAVETEVLKLIRTPLKEVVHQAVAHAVEKVTHPLTTAPAQAAQAAVAVPVPRKSTGVCAAVWGELDQLSAVGTVPTLAQIQSVAKKRKWNANNTRIEYYLWRKAHGIQGRVVASQVPPAVDRRTVQHDRRAAA